MVLLAFYSIPFSKATAINFLTLYPCFTLYLFADDLHLEPCCQYEFYRMKSYLPAEEEEKEKEDEFGPNSFARLRKFVWELFEEPNKTKLGKVLLLAL